MQLKYIFRQNRPDYFPLDINIKINTTMMIFAHDFHLRVKSKEIKKILIFRTVETDR